VSNESLDAAILTDIGGTLTYRAGHDLPALTTVGDLRLIDVLPVLPSLVRIRRTLIAGSEGVFCSGQPGTAVLELPLLERVGAVHLCWNGLQQVVLPELRTVTGPGLNGTVFFLRSTGVTDPVVLPAMTLMKGKLTTSVPLDLPALAEVRGALEMFAPVSAPVLTNVSGTVRFRSGAPIFLPALQSAGAISGGTGTVDLPALTQVGAEGGPGSVIITYSGATSISMPLLESITGDFSIVRQTALTSLDFSSLTSVGPELEISRNRELPNCYAANLVDQLVANGWSGTATVYDNNGTGSCP
jgi:hypothetical protein